MTLPVVVSLPKGQQLGLELAPARPDTGGHVWIASVNPNGPVSGIVNVGDMISRVNEIDTQGKDVSFVSGLILGSIDNPSRSLTLLQGSLPPGASADKENVANNGQKQQQSSTAPKKLAPSASSSSKPKVASKPKKEKKASPFPASPSLKLPDKMPEPGFVCKDEMFYSPLNSETLAKVAEKLGTDWKTMASLSENTSRYGPLKASSKFLPGTLLFIPKDRSKWKMKQLAQPEEEEIEECVDCGIESNPAEMLMCDGCDALHHVGCVGLTTVPDNDWFCEKCLAILKARAANKREGSPLFQLPPLPALELPPEFGQLETRLYNFLTTRRAQAFANLNDYNKTIRQSYHDRELQLMGETTRITAELDSTKTEYNGALRQAKIQQGVDGWSLSSFNYANQWIQVKENGTSVKLYRRIETIQQASFDGRNHRLAVAVMSDRWNRALARKAAVCSSVEVVRLFEAKKALQNELNSKHQSLSALRREKRDLPETEMEEHRRLELEYASLLNEPRLLHETVNEYKRREFPPRFLGRVHLADESDVLAMNMLLEPDELILLLPVTDDKDYEPRVGKEYNVFARMALFDKKRDDDLPMESNGVRDAQRRLFTLLSSNDDNKAILVTRPSIPPTVKLRSGDTNSSCFDLSELVRDCNVDLDLPKEPTPPSMASHGLELRDYQQSSLRWMLDKEKETTGLGLAGELWHRLRFQDPTVADEYFFCELIGSFALDIFDYRADAEQKDASLNRFTMPTGGVLGEEMGLGKTVIAIALIIQNPPPLHNRVLPREHVWSLEKKTTVDHPAYVPPPNVGQTSRLSNGTLIVVPMTLLSQWQTEIERFAPHLQVMTLHNAENPTIQAIATSDVVIASTYLLQQSGPKPGSKTKSAKGGVNLLRLLKRIHWHRLIVDEAHYNQQGHKTKEALAALSATHRASVTGTPIGAQLSDLQGQLRFLRLAPFDRLAFWKNNIEDPYYERSPESLRVLRSLLSHVVVRHSKEQTFENGMSLLSLPPRSIETVLLKFGSEAEKEVYDGIETRNQAHFMKLKRESLATVASKYLVLHGLLTSSRQACAHPSLVDIEKLHNFNEMSSDKNIRTDDTVDDKTREGILNVAVSKARNSAQLRMRMVLNQFQSTSELLECPICFECVGEAEIAVPACAHPFCSHCIASVLSGASSTRDTSGHCPTCRDIMRRSEITYLGDATDAGTVAKSGERNEEEELDSKQPAVCSVNGFKVTASSIHVSVTGASTLRAGRTAMTPTQMRRMLHEDRAFLSTLNEDFLRNYYDCEARVGTKITELLREIDTMTRRDPLSKCVVFSQFLGVLDVASEELQARGIDFVRLDGNCKQHERADALLEFSSNPNTKVFLLSMRSGAVGLTLTAADHCFIMDIAQNSAIEEQAIDRIHRIGQTRPVTVKRFVMQDTVEERLLGVRRSLGVDRPSAGTQICGASVLAGEEKVAHQTNASGEELDNAQRQKRVELLETLFGFSGKSETVHKA